MKLSILYSLIVPVAMARRLSAPSDLTPTSRDLGLFDSQNTDSPCATRIELKRAFTHKVARCEKALVVQAVTFLRKNAGDACEHDTGREMMLLTNTNSHDEAKTVLTHWCEDIKRSYENDVGCSKYPTYGYHDGTTVKEISPGSAGKDRWEWYECAKLCAANEKCEFWTLRLESNRACLLRKDKGEYNERDAYMEGSVDLDCLEDPTEASRHARYLDVDPSITTLFPLNLHGCSADVILSELDDQCLCNAEASLMETNSFTDVDDLHRKLEGACTEAWDRIVPATWQHVSEHLDDETIALYAKGGTDLNTGTGNLGEVQMANYPTDPTTLKIAADVREFMEDGHVQDAPLSPIIDMDQCELPAMMCCFGRDRQDDDDGSCDAEDCDDERPNDNSNLCFKEGSTESNIHCHGFAWAENMNDVTSRLRFNNFFFVSLYDHWYTRGYVENSLDSQEAFVGFPMCGCIDRMPAVSRSDCTEVEVEFDFTISFDGSTFSAESEDQQRMGVRFNACTGPRPDEPLKTKSNDLSTYISKLVYQNKMSPATRDKIFQNHLVGHDDPDANTNEPACQDYMDRTLPQITSHTTPYNLHAA